MAYIGLPVSHSQVRHLGIEDVQPIYDIQQRCYGEPYPQQPVFEES
jgi:hypothetical protein